MFGKIEGINDLVLFESTNSEEIEKEFHDAVDDYLEFCDSLGKVPNKTYSGTFNVRISPELHKKLSLLASKNGTTLNKTVEQAIAYFVTDEMKEKVDTMWKQHSDVKAFSILPVISLISNWREGASYANV